MENQSLTFDPRLDGEILFELYEDDSEHACLAFNQFLLLAPGLMDEIERSYASGIVENFRQKVHKIKPMFSLVGLPALTHIAGDLEGKCKLASHPIELKLLYDELKSGYAETFPIIQQEVNRLNES